MFRIEKPGSEGGVTTQHWNEVRRLPIANSSFRLGVFRIAERRGLTTDAAGRTSLAKGAVAAGFGGALGSIIGTPFFLVKTRLQSQSTSTIAVGHQHEHRGTFSALMDIYRREGLKG